jgi:hypothetical protein
VPARCGGTVLNDAKPPTRRGTGCPTPTSTITEDWPECRIAPRAGHRSVHSDLGALVPWVGADAAASSADDGRQRRVGHRILCIVPSNMADMTIDAKERPLYD